MKKITILALLVIILALTSVFAVNARPERFQAQLTGSNEVPPVSTEARGRAVFTLSADGSRLRYRVTVADLVDTLQAHIHVAPPGVNGPVVAFLYPSGPPPVLIPGSFSGVLAEGVITADNLVGPLAGMSLDALMAEIDAGNAYVNVHTVANPGGEIRGQIR